MSRQFLLAVGAGALAALFYVAVGLGSFGSLILAYLAQLPLFAIGLGAGFHHALLASGIGAVLIAAALPLSAAGLFLLTAALPVLVLTNRALLSRTRPDGVVEWYPPGHLVAILNGMALAALIAAALVFWGQEGGMVGAARELLAEMMRGPLVGGLSEQAVAAAQHRLAWFLPALVLSSWQIMVMVNGMLAQGVLSRFSLNIRPGAPFRELWLPQWLSIALAAALVASFVPGRIGDLGGNAAIVAALPFVFLGLSVIHALSVRWPARIFVLICVYLALFVAGWPAVIVAAIGFLETWLSLRERFSRGRSQDEEE
ncbi:MAG: DUF2232 domain-containing protein [Defluviicoccus sp.]|nr:DUF2232 domain-containing protein [Defluviicoccus sp.]MDE0274985.1 DUF2232 domain-containing protein [Defluviicoccus sp.]